MFLESSGLLDMIISFGFRKNQKEYQAVNLYSRSRYQDYVCEV